MSELTSIFGPGAKVVISPDKMRAWVSLPPPPKGVTYTAQAIAEWLPQKGVVYGADDAMMRAAVGSGKYDDLLEVARGKAPVAATGGSYTLRIEKKPFTGLSGSSDGALFYDDLSFLQEAQAGDVLADIVPASPAQEGMTVTGEALAPRAAEDGRTLEGSGFEISGGHAIAPVASHVSFVGDKLILTPMKKIPGLAEADGPFEFEGNVVVEGDVMRGAEIHATGSIYVMGRASAARLIAGNNVLLAQGMRSEGGFGHIEAKGHVWGQFFESCEITAGGELCANHLSGCEATAGGRANILGGRALIARTNLYAKNGVVAGQLGEAAGDPSVIAVGMGRELIDRFEGVNKKAERLGVDIQALQQNIVAHERVNKMRVDKGKNDPAYKDMVKKRDQSLSVLKILTEERTRLKRSMEQFSNVSIIARSVAMPGVTVSVDTRTLTIASPMQRIKFHRNGEVVEAVAAGAR